MSRSRRKRHYRKRALRRRLLKSLRPLFGEWSEMVLLLPPQTPDEMKHKLVDEMRKVEQLTRELTEQLMVSCATGADLDRIAELIGVPRS